MPSNVVPRAGGFGARVTMHGQQMWLGTFASPDEAHAAIARARGAFFPRAVRTNKDRKPKPKRRRPPSMEVCGRLADAMPTGTLRAFVLVAAWSGLRLSEVAALEARDVGWRQDGGAVLHVRHGKGDKEGWSVLFPAGADVLRAHVRAWPSPAGKPLLLNSERRPWDRKSVNKVWLRARAQVPGCEETTFHALRKAHASWLLDQGVSDIDVAVQLRHIDSLGRPDPSLVREVYGYPAIDAALARVRSVA